MMVAAVLPWVLGVLTLALALAAWRLLRGPSLPDRILALDTLYINALAVLVTLGLAFGHKHYFEVALLIGGGGQIPAAPRHHRMRLCR